MKKRAAIKLLAAPEDQDALQGVWKELRTRGIQVSPARGALRKKDIVLAVLSDRFYEDARLKEQLFQQLALGADTILPLKLGDSPVPRDIMDLLFARNIIPVSGRDDVQVAERILSAVPQKRNAMPMILSAAAVVLMLLGGIFLWRSMQKPEEPEILETEPVVYHWGITQEDLAKIQNVVIVGDQFVYQGYEDLGQNEDWAEIYDFAYEAWDEDGRHWYSTEDGQEYTLTRYEDLRFLELMPNLRRLRMALVDVEPEMLPDLSGSRCLTYVSIHDCSITDVEWIAGNHLYSLDLTCTPIGDYSPLTRCDSLAYAYIDGFGRYMGDVSGFAPPALVELTISNLQPGVADLSGLGGCTQLTRLTLDSLQITDLDFLAELPRLEVLTANNCDQLQDISVISTLKSLRELWLRRCDMVTDYTPVSSCSTLNTIHIERDHWIPVDSSFLIGPSRLHDIGLYGLNLNNMDFLATLENRQGLNLGFAGDIEDYSGLEEISYYNFLHVNPRGTGLPYGDYSLVAPYLQNVSVGEIELYNCTNVNLETLPQISTRLTLTGGDLEDLSGLRGEKMYRLELRNMQHLRTLDGIEGLSKLRGSVMQLSVVGCPRLTDYEALSGADLYVLKLVDMYSLPDFSTLNIKTLCLESILEMEDLSCLAGMDKTRKYQFQFPGLDDLKDLSVLREFHGGALYVPPQVADQAQELVDQGNFTSYEVRYPESGWDPLTEEVTLLSLEELETLPKAVLRRVSRVWIAGDEVIDPDRFEVWNEWIDNGQVPVLYDRQTGQKTRIESGPITDFSMLSDLTRIRELRLICQPLKDLEGIQHFTELTCFDARFCSDLTDVSALFAQQGLEEIWLSNSGVQSIQGVQNLPRLRCLGMAWTQVSDISALAEVDYTAVREAGGLHLEVENCSIEDLSPLSAIPQFSYLGIYSYPAESWMGYVEQAQIRSIGGQMGSDEMLQTFVRQHPELEEMHMEACHQLTDLTPLLELEKLCYVHIWDGAYAAGQSLNGYERRFQLDVD